MTSPSTAVVGLGYVGLPLAIAATFAGHHVVGFDLSAQKVEGLASGRSHVDDISDAELRRAIEAGFEVTTDESRLGEASVIVVCVPTPLGEDGGPDLSAVMAAAETISRHLRPGALVVLESTTYPGSTEETFVPLLERSGLSSQNDFHVAYSPERVDPGNASFGIQNTPKVIGGLHECCTVAATDFYGRFVDSTVLARGIKEAEMAKLLENTYRHVNIALVNEMCRFSYEMDIDFWNVLDCAATKPFGFQAFRPGPGVGGHCIPIDPNYLSHAVRAQLHYAFRFVELAQEINASMPSYVVRRVQDLLNERGKALNGSRVLLLGVTYKADIADVRETPATEIVERLWHLGADVCYHDPYVADWEVDGRKVPAVASLTPDALGAADATILLQAHAEYELDECESGSQLFFDTRGVTSSPTSLRL
jgi:UDP-N-acetyl-D-glucosamine dehydrogenase